MKKAENKQTKEPYSHWPQKTDFKTLADKHKKIRQEEYHYLKLFSLL